MFDNTENDAMADADLEGYILKSRRFRRGRVYLLSESGYRQIREAVSHLQEGDARPPEPILPQTAPWEGGDAPETVEPRWSIMSLT